MDARTAAVTALTQVYADGRSLSDALRDVLPKIDEPRDRALAQDIGYGVLRWSPRLEAVACRLLRKPLHRRDTDVYCLILCGLYQLMYSRVPPHAAVAESVNTAERLDKAWARGLVNAVLRRFQREQADLLADADRTEASALAHPQWMIDAIRADWPQDWRTILAAGNERPPMAVRVNRRRTPRAAYLEELRERGINATAAAHAEEGVILEQPVDVAVLPGFDEGRVSVQDAAAQLAAGLLDASDGHRVLDLCAAPGGKTAHILERAPGLGGLVAVDHDRERMGRVRDNLSRLRLDAQLITADAAAPGDWWDGIAFDRILLDAPCSATGVIRRHPDIKRLRQPRDIEALARTQQRLLEAAWPLLTAGGVLLYVTCSIIHVENDRQIGDFLARHDDARELPIDAAWGRRLLHGRQILPGEAGMDGFFYARIEKSGHLARAPSA